MPKEVTINYSKKDKETQEEISGAVTFPMPETVDEAVQMWGEEVCLGKLSQSVVINVQSVARAAENTEAAQESVNKFTPGVTRTRASGGFSQKAMLEAMKGLPKEELAAIMAQAAEVA